MLLSELLKRLSYGELSNLAISQEGSGSIVEAKVPQLVGYANEALLRLYSRFLLLEKTLIIDQVAHITSYALRIENAQSQAPDGEVGNPPYRFIMDSEGEPFTGDVIKILEVHDSFGNEFFLNDASKISSVFTPYPDVLQIPRPRVGVGMSVLYQARHPKLFDETMGEGAGVLDQNVNIPFSLEGALQSIMAGLVFSHMNGQENVAKSQEFFSWAEVLCTEVEQKDLVSQSNSSSHHKFEQRGFV